MSEFRVGDVVRCVNKTFGTVIEGEIRSWSTDWIFLNGCLWAIEIDLWDVSLVKAAPEPLPTESSVYTRASGSQNDFGEYHTDHREFYYLNTVGKWCDFGWGNEPVGDGPLTRLEPVPETAKRIIDQLRARKSIVSGTHVVEMHHVDQVGKEFGVTP